MDNFQLVNYVSESVLWMWHHTIAFLATVFKNRFQYERVKFLQLHHPTLSFP
jgi:hypothetical protein